ERRPGARVHRIAPAGQEALVQLHAFGNRGVPRSDARPASGVVSVVRKCGVELPSLGDWGGESVNYRPDAGRLVLAEEHKLSVRLEQHYGGSCAAFRYGVEGRNVKRLI